MTISKNYGEFLSQFDSDKFKNLWPAQAYVLNEYSKSYTSKYDVAIELPTGAGKTLIALLIGEAWRQEGNKVAILSANKTLARQMLQESKILGIPSILMEGKGIDIPSKDRRAYQRANSVAIMNYWVYFNQNPVVDPSDLLIMDDAHLAEHSLHSLYSVEFNRFSHESLFQTLVMELYERFPEYTVLSDALEEASIFSTPTELFSFIDQVNISDRIREIVDCSPDLEHDADLSFRWKRIRNKINESNIYLNVDSILIRPYVYPLLSNLHYSQTKQRIYLSATVGESSDLSRRLGVRKIEKMEIPSEHSDRTFGWRMILMNRIGDGDIPDRMDKAVLTALRIHPKSVWLCSSYSEANKYKELVSEWLNSHDFIGHPTWLLSPQGDEIDQFKQAEKGHIFVAGRYDGMDFQADECRLVIIPTLPRAINTQEDFISAYLRDSGFMRRRLNKRIVQALGRCNRYDEDYGVYILTDRRFATHFGRESNKIGIPSNILAEIDYAQDLAEIDETELLGIVDNFLQGSFEQHDGEIENYLDALPEENNGDEIPDISTNEILGWTALFGSQNYSLASDYFESCWNAALQGNLIEMGAFYGWQWAKALYLESTWGEPGTRDKALIVFERAIRRGGNSSWFNRMRASLNRARRESTGEKELAYNDYTEKLIRRLDDILELYGMSGNRFERWCNQISEELQSANHSQFSSGLKNLGYLLGYDAIRPKSGGATDCLWRGVFGNQKEVITFEAKIEHEESGQITSKHIGQAHNQLARAYKEYDQFGYVIRGSIVTHLTELSESAESAAGDIKIIEKEAIYNLWIRVRTLLSSYRDNWSLDDLTIRLEAAQPLREIFPSQGWIIRALDADQRFVSSIQLLDEWT